MTDHPSLVVDTSVLIDGANLDHPRWRDAFTYLQGGHLVKAPELLISEAGNIVHHKQPDVFGENASERSRALQALLMGIEQCPRREADLERCGRLSETMGLTFYDAEFLSLAAEEEDSILITHDRELLEAGKQQLGEDRCLTLDEASEKIARDQL